MSQMMVVFRTLELAARRAERVVAGEARQRHADGVGGAAQDARVRLKPTRW